MEADDVVKELRDGLTRNCDAVKSSCLLMEDLLFRAQKMSFALRHDRPHHDHDFVYDLRGFRAEIRKCREEISALCVQARGARAALLEQRVSADNADKMRILGSAIKMHVQGLHDSGLLAQQHIRSTEFKVDFLYLFQDIQDMIPLSEALAKATFEISSALSGDAPRPGDP